ncbi:MAG: hypothetical protein ACFFB0_07345 [Promethearchaeota archaeon]
MKSGEILGMIGACIGLLSIIFSFIFPELSWYKYEVTDEVLELTSGAYLTGFGTYISTGTMATPDIAILMLIGGILIVIGSVLCIVSVVKELKIIGVSGGILILLGPVLLIIDLLTGMSEIAETISTIDPNVNMFWDSFSESGITFSWGLWIGFYIALAGGILGLIGGALV